MPLNNTIVYSAYYEQMHFILFIMSIDSILSPPPFFFFFTALLQKHFFSQNILYKTLSLSQS